jgi:hypothetical protein
MPIPLPESVVSSLRDPGNALAAAFIIACRHPEVLTWVVRVTSEAHQQPRDDALVEKPRKANGGRKRGGPDHRRVKRDRDDEALQEAMQSAPTATIADWAGAIGKSRTSTVAALHRLRDAGLASNEDGRWALVEESRELAERWVAPLSGAVKAHAHAV